MNTNGVHFDAVDPSLLMGGDMAPSRVRGTAIRFYFEVVQDAQRTAEAGCPKFSEVEYIEILTPGDKTNVVQRPVRQQDKQQYAQQYAAWKAGNSEQLVGTPLSQWTLISRAQAKELEYFGCRTVEQLAEVSDANIHAAGPTGRTLREQARTWLEAAKSNAPLMKMQADLEAKNEELAALRQQVLEMKATLEGLSRKGK
jgi:hypothetical protein